MHPAIQASGDDGQGRVAADSVAPHVVDHAAAIDDCLGGFAAPADTAGSAADAAGDAEFSGLLDIMLLLRQSAAGETRPADAATPETIGRYRVIRAAGQGGFAVVWEAFDPLLRRRVAVKVLRPEAMLSQASRRRFVREAEIASRLVHPGIVTIFEVGEDGDRPFIATEYCAGGSLAGWLARHPGPIAPRTAARIVLAVARAVAHAHATGIIHRDIKPGNVMLAATTATHAEEPILDDDTSGQHGRADGFTVKLGDFGLGKIHSESDAADPLTQLTGTGANIGTPAWMAPEQIDRSFGDVGPATDIHALGLLLDRLLTGRALRGGRTDVETYRQVLLEEAVPPDRVVRGVPRDLGAVCLRGRAKRPADRYPSALAVADDLVRWLDGRPTLARPLAAPTRLARLVARRPVVATLAAAACLASTLAGWSAIDRVRARRDALMRQDEQRRQSAAMELRRGFEALNAGNVAGALDQLHKTRTVDAALADSIAGRWLVRRSHGEREILMRLAAESAPVAGQSLDIHAVVVSPDGRMAATACADGSLRLLRNLVGTPAVETVAAHAETNGICFARDGGLLATTGQDGTLKWWAIDARGAPTRLVGAAPAVACPLFACGFSPDGRRIAYGGGDRILRIVDLATPDAARAVHTLPAPADRDPEIEAIAFLDDRRVAVACGDRITVVDLADPAASREWPHPWQQTRNAVIGFSASADGRLLVAGGTDRTPRLWDATRGEVLVTLPEHPAWVQGCGLSPDGSTVATGCRDGMIRVFDATSGKEVAKLVGHSGRVWDVDFMPDGTLLSAGADGTVRRWVIAASGPPGLRQLPLAGPAVHTVAAVSLAGQPRVVVQQPIGAPVIVDPDGRTVAALGPLPGAEFAWWMAVDSPRRRACVTTGADRRPRILPLDGGGGRVPTGAETVSVEDGAALCWMPDGRLVLAEQGGVLCTWSADLDRLTRATGFESRIFLLAAAPVGPARVAVSGDQVVIHALDAPTDPRLRLQPMKDRPSAVAWSPDGRFIACGTRAGEVQVCDAATGTRIGTLVPHATYVDVVAYSADGRIIVTAAGDCLRLSDAATLTTFDEIHLGWRIITLCFAADSSCIAIGGAQPADMPSDDAGRLAVLRLEVP